MTIKTKYNFGDIVYLKHDPKQRGYEVVGFSVLPGGTIMLELDYLGSMIDVHEFQISHEKDILKSITAEDLNDD